ncbi:uncharacterized protein IAS62_004023 [Cryptococcus decagattii]|uniref:Transcriptional regulatory protein RXT2 N-terminal domain-containing protein n=1 Tax=Cryptococcus decagattii TaxID=1859122 RepID=A0ABZ2AWB2_9TREE
MAALPQNHLVQHIPRKTSSPLSSPNSSVDRGMPIATTPSAHNGLSGSPATSSTLPLTDDEKEDNDTDDLTDNRMNRLGSQATTTSLTPPPSDPPVNSSRLDYSHNCNADQIISLSHAHKRSNGDGDVTMRPTDDDGEDSDQGTVNGIINSTEDGFLQKPFRHIEEPTDIAGITNAADPPFTGAEAHMTEYDWIEPPAPETIPPILLKQSSHVPPLPPSALRQLLLVEVKLAELRNCLYLEKMEEAAAEEEMILKGASRRFEAQLAEFRRMRDAERHLIWSTWTEERDKLHWDEFQTTWSKRRKLAREKGLIETTRRTKPVPSLDRPNHIHRFDWYQDAVPAPMAGNVAHMEVLAMSRRPPIILPLARHASPAALPSSTGTIQHSGIVSDGPNIYTAFGRTSRPTNTSLEFTTSTAAI